MPLEKRSDATILTFYVKTLLTKSILEQLVALIFSSTSTAPSALSEVGRWHWNQLVEERFNLWDDSVVPEHMRLFVWWRRRAIWVAHMAGVGDNRRLILCLLLFNLIPKNILGPVRFL